MLQQKSSDMRVLVLKEAYYVISCIMQEPSDNKREVLNSRDILQIDATVIVGALVLLSLTNIQLRLPGIATQNPFTGITMTIIVPFCASAILAIIPSFGVHFSFEKKWAKVREFTMALSKFSMIAGFLYIMAWLYIIASRSA